MLAPYDAQTVILRLEEAGRTLLTLPDRGHALHCRTYWPTIVHAAADAYGWEAPEWRPAIPSAQRITRMDEALRWVGMIPLERPPRGCGQLYSRHGGAILRRLVLMRALINPRTDRHIYSWRRLGAALGYDREALPRWHAKGIDTIVANLNRHGLCHAAGGPLGPGPRAVAGAIEGARRNPLRVVRTGRKPVDA